MTQQQTSTPHPGGPQAHEEASEGKRSGNATPNIEQARRAGIDSPAQGSGQGKDIEAENPGRARRD
ncbi:MAG: hypothetical protein KA795_04805 [Burkholderiaceae bacterium]|nr:hypothetical protein [Burkholderiaceae bacterium]